MSEMVLRCLCQMGWQDFSWLLCQFSFPRNKCRPPTSLIVLAFLWHCQIPAPGSGPWHPPSGLDVVLPRCSSSFPAKTLCMPGCEQPQLLAPWSQEGSLEHSGCPLPSKGGGPGKLLCKHLPPYSGWLFFLPLKQQFLAKSNRWRKSPLSVPERRISPGPLPLARKNQSYNKHWMLSFRLCLLSWTAAMKKSSA